MERLQKVIASAGICSRRKAEELILAGRVKVNGNIVNTLGTKVELSDLVLVDDKPLVLEDKVYYLFNKPRNCVVTVSDDRERPTVMNYFKDVKYRVFPVGRLDFDTTGALLMTNDGELANKLIHPRYEKEKVYLATCQGKLEEKDMKQLLNGITLEDGFIKAKKALIIRYNPEINTTLIELTIIEGRNHLVKRMVLFLGSEVISLHRKSFAGLTVDNLPKGKYRELTKTEVLELKK